MHRSAARLGIVIVVATVLLASACGGGGGSGDDDKAGKKGDRGDGREPTPLDEFWNSVGGSGEELSHEDQQAQQRRVEQATADCMRAEGFEYTPVDIDFSEAEEVQDDGPWSLPQDEFAEKYGYGMFTIDDSEMTQEEEEGPTDPNMERMGAMSDSERTAYEEALWGVFVEETGETTKKGCSQVAWEEETGEDSDSYPDEEEFAGLWDEMDALWQRQESDSRVVAAEAKWADCMAEAGFDGLSKQQDAMDSVQHRYEEMNPQAAADAEAARTAAADGVVAPTEFSVGGGSDLDPEDLRELRKYEIKVAVADRKCSGDLEDVRYEVQVELEEKFVEDNRAELERYREAMGSVAAGG